MAKSWKPKIPKAFQPYKPPKIKDPFKDYMKGFALPKEPKFKEPKVKEMHSVTLYEKQVQTILCKAISEKYLVMFWYTDKEKDYEDWRIVEPYLIGELKSTGNIILSGWYLPTQEQHMEYDVIEGWGNYILGNIDIKQIEIMDKKFQFPKFGYNPNDKRMSIIHCRTQ